MAPDASPPPAREQACEYDAPVSSPPPDPALPIAAGVLVIRDDGRVLAVSRGADLTDWGLPFGQGEPGEDPRTIALRELHEETGLDGELIEPIYEAQAGTRWAITFLARVTGELRSSDEGEAAWVDYDRLTAPTSRHAEYNRAVLRQLLAATLRRSS
jgi:8-oxo-dGTP pyrophosphatase MutT (NUDIX family)